MVERFPFLYTLLNLSTRDHSHVATPGVVSPCCVEPADHVIATLYQFDDEKVCTHFYLKRTDEIQVQSHIIPRKCQRVFHAFPNSSYKFTCCDILNTSQDAVLEQFTIHTRIQQMNSDAAFI